MIVETSAVVVGRGLLDRPVAGAAWIRGHAGAITESDGGSDQMGDRAIIRIHPTRILSIGLQSADLEVEPHRAKAAQPGRRMSATTSGSCPSRRS